MLIPPDWPSAPPLHRLELDWLARAGIEVAVLRLDLIDSLVSGNKWYKLRPHLQRAAEAGRKGVMTLGGAHSNHLHAVAAAGARFGFATVGLLRGEPCDTPTVRDLQAFGMELHWLGYGGYRARHRDDFWQPWLQRYPELQPVPEGGGGLPGAQGCAALVALAQGQLSRLGWDDFHGWWLAAGTGTTLAGLALAENGRRQVHGALAVPDDHGVARRLAELGVAAESYRLHAASRGGFARVDDELLRFMGDTEQASGVPLEPLYTAKVLLALRERAGSEHCPSGARLIFVHTGGLQGRRALEPALAVGRRPGPLPA